MDSAYFNEEALESQWGILRKYSGGINCIFTMSLDLLWASASSCSQRAQPLAESCCDCPDHLVRLIFQVELIEEADLEGERLIDARGNGFFNQEKYSVGFQLL